ncbi:hypothetical protein HNR46_002625 [Haloferula luteola]|uniref:Uncharacterized protein n=1 Tax=Haloferula luteola TaxID=595692 RepID=A0A840VEW2_9BACT|nr:hypothetical protein [Haloferula luteola]MBB5352380.1 hypothetical protein [Haloferula luteola]
MTLDDRAAIYRRLSGTEADNVEEAMHRLREQSRQHLSPPGQSVGMDARPFEFVWEKPVVRVRSIREAVVVSLLASGVMGTLAMAAAMGGF